MALIATLNRIEAILNEAAPSMAFLRCGYFVETWSKAADQRRPVAPKRSTRCNWSVIACSTALIC